jgi:hypothetical protein
MGGSSETETAVKTIAMAYVEGKTAGDAAVTWSAALGEGGRVCVDLAGVEELGVADARRLAGAAKALARCAGCLLVIHARPRVARMLIDVGVEIFEPSTERPGFTLRDLVWGARVARLRTEYLERAAAPLCAEFARVVG